MAPAVEEVMKLIQQQLDDANRLKTIEAENAARSEALQERLGDHYHRLLRQQKKQQQALRPSHSLGRKWSPERRHQGPGALASPISRAGYESSFTTSLSSTLAYSPSLVPTPGVSEEVFNNTMYASSVAGRRLEKRQQAAEPLPASSVHGKTQVPPPVSAHFSTIPVTPEQVLKTFESVCVTKQQQASRHRQQKSSPPPRTARQSVHNDHRGRTESPPHTVDRITESVLKQHSIRVAAMRAATCAAMIVSISKAATRRAPPLRASDRVVVKSGVYRGRTATVNGFENGFVLLSGLGTGVVMEHPDNMTRKEGSRTPSPQKVVAYTEWKPASVPQDLNITSPGGDEEEEMNAEDYIHFREENFNTMFNGANSTPKYASLNVTPPHTPPKQGANPPPKQPRMNKSALIRIEAGKDVRAAQRSRSTPKRYYTSKEMVAYANSTPKKAEQEEEICEPQALVTEEPAPATLAMGSKKPLILPLGKTARRSTSKRREVSPQHTPEVVVAEPYSPESVKNGATADEWEGEIESVAVTPQPLPTPPVEKGLGTLLDDEVPTKPASVTRAGNSWSPPKLPNLSPNKQSVRSTRTSVSVPAAPMTVFSRAAPEYRTLPLQAPSFDDDDYAGDALSDEEEIAPPREAEALCKNEAIQRKLHETEEGCGRALCKENKAAHMEALFGKMQERMSLFRLETEMRRRMDRQRIAGIEAMKSSAAEQQHVLVVPVQEESNRLRIEKAQAGDIAALKRKVVSARSSVSNRPAGLPVQRAHPPKSTRQQEQLPQKVQKPQPQQRSVLRSDSVPYHPLVAEHQAQFLIIEEQAARHALRREQQEARTDLRRLREADVSAALDSQLHREESVIRDRRSVSSLRHPSPAYTAQKERQDAIREKANADKEAALQANYYPLLNKRSSVGVPRSSVHQHQSMRQPVLSGPVAVTSDVGMVSSYKNEAVYRDVSAEMDTFLTVAQTPDPDKSIELETPATQFSPAHREASSRLSYRSQGHAPSQPQIQGAPLQLRASNPHEGIGLDIFMGDISEYDDENDPLGTIVAPSQEGRLSTLSSALLATEPPERAPRSTMFGPGEEGVLASLLDRENASLRSQISKLQSENAMKDRQICTLRATSSPSPQRAVPDEDEKSKDEAGKALAGKLQDAAEKRRLEEKQQEDMRKEAERKKEEIKAAAKKAADAKAAEQRKQNDKKESVKKAAAEKAEAAKRQAATKAEEAKKQEQEKLDRKHLEAEQEAARKKAKEEEETARKAEIEAEAIKKEAEKKQEEQEEEEREHKRKQDEERENKKKQQEEEEEEREAKRKQQEEEEQRETKRKQQEEEEEAKRKREEELEAEKRREEEEREEAARKEAELQKRQEKEDHETSIKRGARSEAASVSTVDSTVNKRSWYAKWSGSKKKYYFVKGNTTSWEYPAGAGDTLPCVGGPETGNQMPESFFFVKEVVPKEPTPKAQPKRSSFIIVDKTPDKKPEKPVAKASIMSSSSSSSSEVVKPVRRRVDSVSSDSSSSSVRRRYSDDSSSVSSSSTGEFRDIDDD